MTNAAPSAMAPGGGQAPSVHLRTLPPLPHFRVPHPIPDAAQPISALKLSILSILTGQVSPASSTQAAVAAMTHSERLKQETLQGWRREMIRIELRQNALIAPETREGQTRDEELEGFELADDHDCALLEDGDEIIIRVKPPHTLESLRLPALPRGHAFGLPAGSLTRAGTLSAPPPYSVLNPREPSSHSSSVAGQPQANFHQHQYRDPSRGFRVISAAEASGAQGSRPRPRLGNGRSTSAAGPTPGPYRPPPLAAAPPEERRRRGSRNGAPASPPLDSGAAQSGSRTPTSATGLTAMQSPPPPAPHRRHTSGATSHDDGQRPAASATGGMNGSGPPAGAASMPSTALVIGPGVQGRFGAVPAETPAQSNPEYGNAAAFASFTAASGEVRPAKPKKKHSSNGRASRGEGDREGRARVAAEAAERRAQELAVEGEPARPRPAGRQMSSSSAVRQRVELPPAPLLPPIRNLAPFPSPGVSETLAHMPSAATAPTVQPPQGMSALDEQLANDAALALALAEQDDFGPRDDARSEHSGAHSGASRSTGGPSNAPLAMTSSPLASPPIAQAELANGGAAAVDEPRASKADRRFAAVQASLAKERARQAEADKARAVELQAREARRAEEARKRADEEKQRKVQEQWELWEEIRRRERKAGLPPPPVANRLED